MPPIFEISQRFDTPELATRIAQYKHSGGTSPMHVDLDLTSECNYRCRHCGDLARGLLNRGGMPWKVIERLLDDLCALSVHEVALIGGGEPLLSLHFAASVQGLHARGIRCGVVTNGSILDAPALVAMERGCDWVRISLDAATDATYARVHNPAPGVTLATVVDHVQQMVSELGTRVGVSFLITPLNMHEIEAAARLAKDLGVGSIRIRPMQHPISGSFFPLPNRANMRDQLERAAAWADSRFAVSIGESATNGLEPQVKEYQRCHAQAFGATVTGDGKVYVCSKWRGEAWACIGDLRSERFLAIWTGRRRASLLDQLSPARECRQIHCQAHPLNVHLANT